MRRIIWYFGLTLIICSCEQPAAVPGAFSTEEEDVAPDTGTDPRPDDGDMDPDDPGQPDEPNDQPNVVIPLPMPSCGDGRWQREAGESCDDGNVENGDGCSSDCEVATCFVPVTHASIQAGLDDAACAAVYVYSGKYAENVRVERDALILGVGAGPVIVDGDGQGSVFEIRGADVTLQRLAVQNGRAERGGGVYAEGEALTLTDVQVHGNLATGVTLAAGGGIYSTAGRLTLIRTQVTENAVESSEVGRGGGVYVEGTRLALEQDSKVAGNRVQVSGDAPALAAEGGGIFQAIGQAGGELVLTGGSSIHQNLARAEGPGSSEPDMLVIARGGGVAMQSGSLEVTAGGSLHGNRAEAESPCRAAAHGGAVSMQRLASPSAEDEVLRLSVAQGTLLDNHAIAVSTGVEACSESRARGGAVHATSQDAGQVEISIAQGTWISDNKAQASSELSWTSLAQGGGVYTVGFGYPSMQVVIEDSVMNGNAAVADGMAQGGAWHLATLTHDADLAFAFRRSTASDNRAESAAAGLAEGGALQVSATGTDAFIRGEVTNSTLSNNQSVAAAGTGRGGAVSLVRVSGESDVEISFHSSTVAQNHATITGGGFDVRENVPSGQAEIQLRNSILAGNASLIAPDCATSPQSARLQSQGYNLLGSDFGCHFQGLGSTDLVNVDPRLGPLSWNGGDTMTHALLSESPAIDAGDPDGCFDGEGNALPVDQRGWQRVGQCDIGACEHATGDL
jgi:cysteine-rich repeat protein